LFLEENLDYRRYLESIGCAPAEIARMVASRAQHSFGEVAEEYDAPEVEDDAEDVITD